MPFTKPITPLFLPQHALKLDKEPNTNLQKVKERLLNSLKPRSRPPPPRPITKPITPFCHFQHALNPDEELNNNHSKVNEWLFHSLEPSLSNDSQYKLGEMEP